MNAADHARDPGLQPERTALAWVRTGLAFLPVGCLALRFGLQRGNALEVIAAFLLLLLSLLMSLFGLWRQRVFFRQRVYRAPPAPVLWMVCCLVVLIGCLSAWAFIHAAD